MSEQSSRGADPGHGPLLPVVALLASVVGLFVPPRLLVTLGLGAFSFWKAGRDPVWKPRRQLAVLTMAVSGAGVLIFAGFALPLLKRRELRIAQAECATRLQEAMRVQRALFTTAQRFDLTLATDLDPRLEGTCPSCTLSLSCSKNLDADPTEDRWTISSAPRTGHDGTLIPRDVAFNERDDVTE